MALRVVLVWGGPEKVVMRRVGRVLKEFAVLQ